MMLDGYTPIIAIAMLATASYFDIKERSVSDYVWIVYGPLGLILNVLSGSYDNLAVASTFAGSIIALACMYLRLFGQADALAIIALSVILPTYNGLVLPVAVLIAASMISLLYTVISNVSLNLLTLIKEGTIFQDMGEVRYRKVLAFFLIHKRREGERFSFPAEQEKEGKKIFRFYIRADDEFTKDVAYVTTALPLTFFMLIALAILVFLPLSWPDLFAFS